MPSFHEGLPYALLEAMSYGIFCIGNNVPGIDSLIKHNKSGILVDGNLSEGYIDIIERSLNRRDLLEKYEKSCLEVLKKFDRKKFLKEYSNFLDLLL